MRAINKKLFIDGKNKEFNEDIIKVSEKNYYHTHILLKTLNPYSQQPKARVISKHIR